MLAGFYGDPADLWEEKLGIKAAVQRNAAMMWGEANEARALQAYTKITGSEVSTNCMFKVRRALASLISAVFTTPSVVWLRSILCFLLTLFRVFCSLKIAWPPVMTVFTGAGG